MSLSNNPIDYSSFGGTKVEEEKAEPEKQPEIDYSQFGGEPDKEVQPKEKVGKFKSTLLGLYEGVLGIPAVIGEGANAISKGLEKALGQEEAETVPFSNPIMEHLGTLPESENQASRRFRVSGQVIPAAAAFGIPGILTGLVGSQAGQTVREVFGKEGKFDEFGWGEAAALGTDLVFSLGANAAVNIAKGGAKAAQQAAQQTPSIFRNSQTGLQRKVVQNSIQAQGDSLQNVINNFSQKQLQSFEKEAISISPAKFTDLTQSNASQLQQQANNLYRQAELTVISPLAATTEQAGTTIQDAANLTFRTEVQEAERTAYTAAREEVKDLSGQAPKTLEKAKALREELTKVQPTPDQKPVVEFLDTVIQELEGEGGQISTRKANDLIDLIQKANREVNYEGQLREQSHRLSPVVSTLRQELGEILNQNPIAKQLYQDANTLHARNAQVWGTKYMRNVRFAQNPEKIILQTRQASNMRNLKQAIPNAGIQNVAERAVIEQLTEVGKAKSNRVVLNNLSPELSPNARGAAQNLIDVKDPLTTVGGRAALRNQILTDAAKAVNTGQPPKQILNLMKTPKGYQLVRESLNGSRESQALFKSFERLFMERLVSSVTDSTGMIDFSKARSILKNPEMRQVVENIGGQNLLRKFEQLETFANNFQKNMDLYSKPEVQSLWRSLIKESSRASLLATVLHSLHMPWPVIVGLVGTAKLAEKSVKAGYSTLQKKILSNPKAVHYLEKVSEATTAKELAKQLPRLIAELDKGED